MSLSFDSAKALTVADILEMFGPVPVRRIRHDPAPGTATENDVVEISDHEDALCELVEGVLLEKDMGFWESFLAIRISTFLARFVNEHHLGVVAGEAGMMRLAPGLVRIPDVSFVSWDRLAGHEAMDEPILGLAPDLAIEVLSGGNTDREMSRKLDEYFTAGVRLVWYFDPPSRTVTAYTSPEQHRLFRETDVLDAGDLLPGFRLPLVDLFSRPTPPG
jgi:Uma2 family endonuclease